MLVLGIEKIKNKLSDQLTAIPPRPLAPWTITAPGRGRVRAITTTTVSSVQHGVTLVFAPVTGGLEFAHPTLETTHAPTRTHTHAHARLDYSPRSRPCKFYTVPTSRCKHTTYATLSRAYIRTARAP